MLCFTVRADGDFYVDGHRVIVKPKGNSVAVKVDAPPSVKVLRGEVYRADEERRRHAAESVSVRLNAVKMFDRSDWTVDELLSTADPMLRSAVDAEVRAMREAA